jgi:hypothetical protein
MNLNHINLKALTRAIIFIRNLLSGRHTGLGTPQLDDKGFGFRTLNHTGYDIAFAFDEFAIDQISFCLTEALQDQVFGGLSGDTPEIVRCAFHLKEVAEFGFGINSFSFGQSHLGTSVFHILHDGLLGIDFYIPSLRVDANANPLGGWAGEVSLVSRNQSSLNGLDDDILRKAFFTAYLVNRGDKITLH